MLALHRYNISVPQRYAERSRTLPRGSRMRPRTRHLQGYRDETGVAIRSALDLAHLRVVNFTPSRAPGSSEMSARTFSPCRVRHRSYSGWYGPARPRPRHRPTQPAELAAVGKKQLRDRTIKAKQAIALEQDMMFVLEGV